MLTVISPAKRLDWDGARPGRTQPAFADEAAMLAGHARRLSLADLKGLMGLSDNLARLNRDRFRSFSAEPAPEDTRAAVYLFAGDTYQGLEAGTLDDDALRWAQDRLRILSGLYGLLRPFDAIQPHRLEMGSRLKTRRGRTLYDFWGDRIARRLRQEAADIGAGVVLNCASQEYFGAVDDAALGIRVISPVFLEEKGGEARIVSFYAKRARGAMARFVLEARLTDPDDLRSFEAGGYRFDPGRSEEARPVFVRDGSAASSSEGS